MRGKPISKTAVAAAWASPESKEAKAAGEKAAALGWRRIRSDLTAPAAVDAPWTIVLTDLDPYAALEFRVVAHNARGATAGKSTGLILTDTLRARVADAPRVTAGGSATFRVDWSAHASHCRPQLSWRLEVQRSGTPTWVVLASKLAAVSYTAEELHCPEGCAFRVTPSNLRGWLKPSAPSDHVPSAPLEPLAPGASRIELRLARRVLPVPAAAAAAAGGDPSLSAAASAAADRAADRAAEGSGDAFPLVQPLRSAVAHALSLPSARVAVREVRGGRYVVLDLLPPAFSGESPSEAAADVLALQVAEEVLNDGGALYRGAVGNDPDPRYGVLRIDARGRHSAAGRAQLAARGGCGPRRPPRRRRRRRRRWRRRARAAAAERLARAGAAARAAEAAWAHAAAAGGGWFSSSGMDWQWAAALLLTALAACAFLQWLPAALRRSSKHASRCRATRKRVAFRAGRASRTSSVELAGLEDTARVLEEIAATFEHECGAPLPPTAQLLYVDALGHAHAASSATRLSVLLQAAHLRVELPADNTLGSRGLRRLFSGNGGGGRVAGDVEHTGLLVGGDDHAIID